MTLLQVENTWLSGAAPNDVNATEWIVATMRGDPGYRVKPTDDLNRDFLMSEASGRRFL